MYRLLTITLLLGTLVFMSGCGSDDGDNGGGTNPTPLARVQVRTDLSAPPMTSVDDAVWSSDTAKSLALSYANAPDIAAPKALLFSDSVAIQAIAASGRLYVRLEWDDPEVSLKRDNWMLFNASGFNFTHNVGVYNEDQVFVMFELPGDAGWDTWNWRSLTTGQTGCAEDMTFADSALTVDGDNGVYALAWQNALPGDDSRPRWIHVDEADFVGDIMYIDDTVSSINGIGDLDWDIGQTVPGWILVDSVLPVTMANQSRWDVRALYSHDDTEGHYKLVMSRPLSAGTEDLNMTNATEVKARIGITNDTREYTSGTGRLFTKDFIFEF